MTRWWPPPSTLCKRRSPDGAAASIPVSNVTILRTTRARRKFNNVPFLTPPDQIHPTKTLHMARIALHLGEADRARAFAQSGLARAPQAATSLKAKLEQVLAG